MRIITRRKQRELEKRMIANLIIAEKMWSDGVEEEDIDLFIDNMVEIIACIGGIRGMERSRNTLAKYWNIPPFCEE